MAPAVLASIGDQGVLNAQLPDLLQQVWIDRDLSWLDFIDRVLGQALDDRTPLLERVKFLAIFTSNLDEFFMMRHLILHHGATEAQRTLLQQRRDRLLPSLHRQAECYRGTIIPELAKHGVFLRRWQALTPGQQAEGAKYFDTELSPALTPLVIDSVHPFPFLSNLSNSLVFRLRDTHGESMLARVKIPGVVKQWVPLQSDLAAGERLLVPLFDLIRANLHQLYSAMEITAVTMVRLTRDAEVEALGEEEATDFRAAVREEIRKRRYEPVVRLEFGPGADEAIKESLRERFRLSPLEVYDMDEEVDYTTLFELGGLPFPELRDPDWTPLQPAWLGEGSTAIFTAIKAGDVLVHHPYESFDATVERFVSAAADDPQAIAIKMTAYRFGEDTPFVKSLIRAAERGKQVACVMEIKARFDEERNLHWAAELERAGAHVSFGVTGLKTHGKVALVVRKEPGGLQCYLHLGTGNYNVKTARLYEDAGLFTCDRSLTHDAVNFFHYLTGHADAPDHSAFLVAPVTMRPRLLDLIQSEVEHQRSGRPGRIVAKMNQLEDPEIIEALCHASEAGARIDLIIRGFCCLRPGVPGVSANIRVRSIIGRFLEHSRIYYFAKGSENPAVGNYFIGSADWMFRSLSKRVEVITPVLAAGPKQRLWEILDICLRDKRQAWLLGSDGAYLQDHPEENSTGPEKLGTHQSLMDLARARTGR